MVKDVRPTTEEWTQKAFWKQPDFDPSQTGDPNEVGIFIAVGSALSAWEQMEDHLSSLFQMFCTHGQMEAEFHSHLVMRHLYGMTESSSARLKMLQVTASLYFGHYWEYDLVKRPCLSLFEAVSHASHRRNEIAHGRVTRVHTHKERDIVQDSGSFLTSPKYAVNRNQPFYGGKWHVDDVLGIDRSKYRFRTMDIAAFTEKFNLLSNKIFELIIDCTKEEAQLPKIVIRLLREGKIGPGAEVGRKKTRAGTQQAEEKK